MPLRSLIRKKRQPLLPSPMGVLSHRSLVQRNGLPLLPEERPELAEDASRRVFATRLTKNLRDARKWRDCLAYPPRFVTDRHQLDS